MSLDSEVNEILESSKKQDASAKELSKKLQERLKNIQERIIKGETTGDKIKDFVIVHHYGVKEREDGYRTFKNNLDLHKGEQVLVIKQKESIHAHWLLPPPTIDPRFIGIGEERYLGIINTPSLVFDIQGEEIKINMPKHVYDSGRDISKRERWSLEEGGIPIKWYEFMNLGKEIPHRTMGITPNDISSLNNSLNVVMGNNEVELCFALGSGNYWDLKKFFSKANKKSRDKFIKFHKQYANTSYVQALELLGLEAPKEFREKYEQKLLEEKEGIVKAIESDMEKASKYDQRIKNVYEATKSGILVRGGALAIVENEDDAMIASWRDREELKECYRGIERNLRKAIELGMNKDDTMLKLRPGVGVKMSDYISDLCRYFEVTKK